MNGPEAVVVFAMTAFGGVAVLTLVRAIARRIVAGAPGSKEIEALREEVAQLGAEVEDLRGRLGPLDEMQNRLDFAERMLGQARERGLLHAPKDR